MVGEFIKKVEEWRVNIGEYSAILLNLGSLYIVVYMCKVKFISDTHLGNCLIRYNTLFNEDHSLNKTFRYKVLRAVSYTHLTLPTILLV